MATRSITSVPESITTDLGRKGFKIHALAEIANPSVARAAPSGRRYFYKMGLIIGNMIVSYGDKLVEIKDTALFFVNPNIPHSIVRSSKKRKGYACLFTEAFIAGRERTDILQNSPLFRFDGTPVIPLNKEQAAFMTGLFQKMLSVHDSNYQHKDEF